MRGSSFLAVVALTASIGLAPSAVRADPPFSLQRVSAVQESAQSPDRTFTPAERRIVRAYFAEGTAAGKTGAAVPAVLERRFVAQKFVAVKRGEGLARGSAKRLPSALESRLPRRPGGYRRVIVGDDVVLVDTLTNRAIDILEDVVRERS